MSDTSAHDQPQGGLLDLLPENAIKVHATATDWRDAITQVGELLTQSGTTTPDYTTRMIQAIEELGPYIVIAPGVAIAHSRPGPDVLKTGLSWLQLDEPVAFGHKRNDPVGLIVGLASHDHDAHIQALQQMAGVLIDPELKQAAADAATPAELRAVIQRLGN